MIILAIASTFFYPICPEPISLSADFIGGVSFRDVDLSLSKSPKERAEYLQIVFAPIFFVSQGVLVDLRAVIPVTWTDIPLIGTPNQRGEPGPAGRSTAIVLYGQHQKIRSKELMPDTSTPGTVVI